MAGKGCSIFKKYFYYTVFALVSINIILFTHNIIAARKKNSTFLNPVQVFTNRIPNQNLTLDFFDVPCPELTIHSVNGEVIKLRDLAGQVLIIRFSRFNPLDLPNILYLQGLAERYKKYGTFLLLINSRGKHDGDKINRIANLLYPVIEDKGSLMAFFNAYPEDTIIVDRGFSIKFKHSHFSKQIVHDELRKSVFENSTPEIFPLKVEVCKAIKGMSYYDVFKKERRPVYPLTGALILTVSTSICTACDEIMRVYFLKEVARKVNLKKVSILLLFGKGNNPEGIEEYASSRKWNKLPFSIGVIRDIDDVAEDEYYNVFQLDSDPKTYIINSDGELVFSETSKNNKMISVETIKGLLK